MIGWGSLALAVPAAAALGWWGALRRAARGSTVAGFPAGQVRDYGLVCLDDEGRVANWNPGAEELFALSAQEALGRPFTSFFGEEEAALGRPGQMLGEARAEGRAHGEAWLRRRDGGRFLACTTVSRLRDASAPGFAWITRDITGDKHAEQARLQSQKLESIGLLAGGIAHDFNNLLGAMVGHVEQARLEVDGRGPALEHLRTLEELITRASGLVAKVMAYAGKGKFLAEPLDLNVQVEEVVRLLLATLPRKTVLRWEPTPRLPPMLGDLAQVQDLVMNLVLNAAEALGSQGGTVTVRTGTEVLGQDALAGRYLGQNLHPGRYLTLEVCDSGAGIPAAVKERLYDPFFTTKFTGRGLGLSVVRGILKSHQGGIQVQSDAGHGTTFRIIFPAAAPAEAPPAAGPPAPGPEPFRGTGTILVVDDEDVLRAVTVGALRRMGFDTLEARDGREALARFEANRDRIQLVLMDLAMPNMDGEEAYRELRRSGAQVPVVLTSGFEAQDVLLRFQAKGLAGFLQKPYRYQTLASTVRKALGRD